MKHAILCQLVMTNSSHAAENIFTAQNASHQGNGCVGLSCQSLAIMMKDTRAASGLRPGSFSKIELEWQWVRKSSTSKKN
jgi:20S proteasome alpha/beta subunit